MIASTWLDLVVGLDVHFEMVPTPAPFPHPFVGMVFDPVGLTEAQRALVLDIRGEHRQDSAGAKHAISLV